MSCSRFVNLEAKGRHLSEAVREEQRSLLQLQLRLLLRLLPLELQRRPLPYLINGKKHHRAQSEWER